jgi:DNA-binding response OmpR family regulator
MPAAAAAQQRLLVIDDDEKLCRLLADYLTPLNYHVMVEHTGPAGLQRLGGETLAVDLVLLDYMLSGLDGPSVLKKLREMQPDLPVLMFTGCGDEADRIKKGMYC